jgi:hypothetical protein
VQALIITENYLIAEPVFDPLAAAEAADIPLSFYLNYRLNRLVEFQAENNGLGIDDMISVLSSKTWKAPRLKRISKANSAAKRTTSAHVFMAASINDEASFATKAIT